MPEAGTIAVCIVEDDAILREAFIDAMALDPDLVLAGAFADGESFLNAASTAVPDVVIMDLNLPGMDGVACTQRTKSMLPQTQVLVCTVQDDDDSLFNALCAGATGYLLKDTTPAQVVSAVKDLHAGGSPMGHGIARRVVTRLQPPKPHAAIGLLTERERQVLEDLAQGYRYKEIADRLFLSTETIRTHVRNLYEKLHVSSRTDALNKLYPRS